MTDRDRLSCSHRTAWAPVLYDVLSLGGEPALVNVDTRRMPEHALAAQCWSDVKQPGWMA